MNYHNILHDDMRNGDGLRVVLFVSGCDHKCYGCHNPQTWDSKSGILFNNDTTSEIMKELSHDYISGITFSGGDPLNNANVECIYMLCNEIKEKYPNKSIWIYTGYTIEKIFTDANKPGADSYSINRKLLVMLADILVDGKFIKELSDVNYRWAGSTNQRVIDVKKTIEKHKIIFWNPENQE